MCDLICRETHQLPDGDSLTIHIPLYIDVCHSIGIPVISNTELHSYAEGRAVYKHLDVRVNTNLFVVYTRINKNTFAFDSTYITP